MGCRQKIKSFTTFTKGKKKIKKTKHTEHNQLTMNIVRDKVQTAQAYWAYGIERLSALACEVLQHPVDGRTRHEEEVRGRSTLLKILKTYYVCEQSVQKVFLPFSKRLHCNKKSTRFSLVRHRVWFCAHREHAIQYVLSSSNNKVANRLSILLPKLFAYFMNRKRAMEREVDVQSSLPLIRFASCSSSSFFFCSDCSVAWNETDVAIVHEKLNGSAQN